jgi:threonine dehydratase
VIPLEAIRRARVTIAGSALRTPLVRLNAETEAEIWLKLECLQPIGAFKIRGAANALRSASPELVARGVVTASAGNMAQGVALAARELGIPCTVVAPDRAPATKLAAIERLGGRIVKVSYDRWWQTIVDSSYEGLDGLFIHPVQDDAVMAGNGTIGLEVLEDLPEPPDAVLIPWGGGGLCTGIASAVKALSKATRIIAVEPETAAPVAASLAAGEPREIDYRPSFVDGAGGRSVLPKMWRLGRPLLDGACPVSLDETAAAVRLLAERNRVIAEGAGALALAAALSGRVGRGRLVCIVSGGNIDASTLASILGGATP